MMIKMVCGMNCKEIIIFLALPAEKENKPIGVWGEPHLRYLKEYRRGTYINLLTSSRLNAYLAEIDKQAQDITEQLKAENQLEWVQRLNNIRACAREKIFNIYIDNLLCDAYNNI